MKLRNVKFRVSGAEQVKSALTFLFADDQGCQWAGFQGKDVSYRLDATHLFVDHNGRVSFQADGDEDFFRAHRFSLIDVEFKTITTMTMKPSRPKTLLFGEAYYTDDLKAALARLPKAVA